ncbi:hypothetical protein [Cellvibrio sp. NN19]|uniref:hypothetical protein n=1 Tax=Cellvibrio chitinivorans TaxID=3102792 RepID=UPI002B41554F|nr:hypothetical protein [Cellvibrio sp. NN19]
MHRFNLIDAKILLGLAFTERGSADSCTELLACCAKIDGKILKLDELAEAFNKFLYTSVIAIEGESVALTQFGWELINQLRGKLGEYAPVKQLHESLYKELSSYKLKSMCNRTVWTPAQYQQATADLQIIKNVI